VADAAADRLWRKALDDHPADDLLNVLTPDGVDVTVTDDRPDVHKCISREV
jgi:hypothetical protein